MSTTVTFAGHLVDDPELLYTREDRPFVSCRVLVNHRIRNNEGQWVDDEPTPHNVNDYGTAARNLYDCAGRGDRILVQGLLRTETWNDKESGDKRTKQVVEVSSRFGEVGGSFKFTAARIEWQRSHPAPGGTAPSASSSVSAGAEGVVVDLVVKSPDELIAVNPARPRLPARGVARGDAYFPRGCRSRVSTCRAPNGTETRSCRYSMRPTVATPSQATRSRWTASPPTGESPSSPVSTSP